MLVNDVTFKGINVRAACIKVMSPTISEDQQSISFFVRYSATKNDEPFNTIALTCPYDITAENPIKQAYEHLKTLSEYSDATEI